MIRAAVAVLALLAAIGIFDRSVVAASKSSHWGANYFPNHEVVDHTGVRHRFYDDLVRGKIVAINFIYTSCGDICPLQTARMSIVQDMIGERLGKDIFIYSISLDPVRDTPEKLKAYADSFSAKPGWLFLTGDPALLHEIRYKLGERSRSLAEHRNDAVLGNDNTGDWGRSSIMASLQVLADEIVEMDPATRAARTSRPPQPVAAPGAYEIGTRRGQALYLKTCSTCHSIGMGKRVGPDLEGVLDRRGADWVARYVVDPFGMKTHDPIAQKLAREYAVPMPRLDLNPVDAEDIVEYLRTETARLAGQPVAGGHHHADTGHVTRTGASDAQDHHAKH